MNANRVPTSGPRCQSADSAHLAMKCQRRKAAPVAALMGFEALTLAVISSLHLSGVLGGGTKPFNPTAAGIAEAVIFAVLAPAAVAYHRIGPPARTAALAATLFAIVGFIVGLTITLRGGDAIDIAYHATLLPLLLVTFAALLRRKGRNADASRT